MSQVFDQVSPSYSWSCRVHQVYMHSVPLHCETIILERGAFQASQNGRAALATSSL